MNALVNSASQQLSPEVHRLLRELERVTAAAARRDLPPEEIVIAAFAVTLGMVAKHPDGGEEFSPAAEIANLEMFRAYCNRVIDGGIAKHKKVLQ